MKKAGYQTRCQLQKKKAKIAKKLVDKANSLVDPLANFLSFHKFIAKDGSLIEMQCNRVQDLVPEMLVWIFDLMECNMKQMYEQSAWGWDLVAKQDELTESEARYLIALLDGKPIGFSHFRFDLDYGVEVLYCYELQLEPMARRKGLGCFMMQALESMALQNKMQKVVLTVLKHNPAAISFFHTIGFQLDNTSPSSKEKLDYVILSKKNLCHGPTN